MFSLCNLFFLCVKNDIPGARNEPYFNLLPPGQSLLILKNALKYYKEKFGQRTS